MNFDEDRVTREKEPAVPQKQRSKERPGWLEDEPVTELGEQFRQEQRQAHLQRRRQRVAAESTEQRAARLQQVSANQRERLATESAEEREARLLHVCANQRERRAAVSSSLTHATIEEPFKQRSVQLKMRKFHEHLPLSAPLSVYNAW